MQIICPECKFAREVDESKIPARSQVATCPKCQTKFKFRDLPEPEFIIEDPEPESAPAPQVEKKPVRKPAPELPLLKAAQPAPTARVQEPKTKAPEARKPEAPKPEPKEPERVFPDLVDPDEESGETLWQRLHSMPPPPSRRTVKAEPEETFPEDEYDVPVGEPDDTPAERPQASAQAPVDDLSDRYAEPAYRQDPDQQPVPGWTGEFNDDFPDPMQGEFLEEEYDEPLAENPLQVPPPFEQLDRYGFFHGFFLTLKLALLSPRLFFSVMPVGNGLSKPLTFAILVGMIQTVGQYAWGTAGLIPGIDITEQGIQAVPYDTSTGIFELLFTPAIVAISLFAISGFYNLILSILKGSDKGFEGTFRAVAYAYAPMVLGIVPTFTLEFMAGWIILYTVWGIALTAIGLKHIHGSTYGKVVPALILPPLVFAVIALLLARAQLPTI